MHQCTIKKHHTLSIKLFDQLGVCREQARGVLPQNLYTEYYGTVNLSNLLKFIDLRTHEGAQWEIQKVAEACLEIATDLFPETVGAYKRIRELMAEKVNHPDHYGGESNPYEAIKVIEAWDLNFHLGNVVKYISRAGKKSKSSVEDLKKAEWYLSRYVQFIQKTDN